MTKKEKAKPAFAILDGAKAIEKAIVSIASRGKTLERDIHKAAVSCLNHADLHGDITLANKLVEAVPTMSRKNALRDWFMAFGKFGYDAQNKALSYAKGGVTLLDDAIETPFWAFKPEAEYVPFDITKAVTQLIQRAEKAVERGDKVPAAKLDQLRKIAA